MFVLGFEDTNTKKIKKCSNNSDKIQLEKCEDFTDKEVLHFFYKHGNYVIVTKSQEIMMCNHQTEKCDSGQMRTNWKIDSILLEGFILLLAVND